MIERYYLVDDIEYTCTFEYDVLYQPMKWGNTMEDAEEGIQEITSLKLLTIYPDPVSCVVRKEIFRLAKADDDALQNACWDDYFSEGDDL